MKRFLTENTWIKLASLLFAAALWFFVNTMGRAEVSMEAKVNFRNIPEGMTPIRQDTDTLRLRVEGHERVLKNIRPSDVRVTIDLGKARERENKVEIKSGDIELPAMLRLKDIEPSSLKVYLEKNIVKTLPVRPSVTGSPKRGFTINRIEVVPKEVMAEGAKSEMRRLLFLDTSPLDITGASETVVEEANVEKGSLDILVNPAVVTVKVVILKERP